MVIDEIAPGGAAGTCRGSVERLALTRDAAMRWRGSTGGDTNRSFISFLSFLSFLAFRRRREQSEPETEYFLAGDHLYEAVPAEGGHAWRRVDVRGARLEKRGEAVAISDADQSIEIGVDDLSNLGSLLTLLNIDDPLMIESSERGILMDEWPLGQATTP